MATTSAKTRRRIVDCTRSPLNARRWVCSLECGHQQWITSAKRPSRSTLVCETCSKGKSPSQKRRRDATTHVERITDQDGNWCEIMMTPLDTMFITVARASDGEDDERVFEVDPGKFVQAFGNVLSKVI